MAKKIDIEQKPAAKKAAPKKAAQKKIVAIDDSAVLLYQKSTNQYHSCLFSEYERAKDIPGYDWELISSNHDSVESALQTIKKNES